MNVLRACVLVALATGCWGYGIDVTEFRPTPIVLLEGTTAHDIWSFTVRLQTRPHDSVTVNISFPEDVFTYSGPARPYTWTNANWDAVVAPKAVTLTYVDNGISDAVSYYNVTFSVVPGVTTDPEYASLEDLVIPVTVYDKNQSVLVSNMNAPYREGESVVYRLARGRTYQPPIWLNFTGGNGVVSCGNSIEIFSSTQARYNGGTLSYSGQYWSITCTSTATAGWQYPQYIPFPFEINAELTADEGYKNAIVASADYPLLESSFASGPETYSVDATPDGTTEYTVSVASYDFWAIETGTAVMNVTYSSGLNNTSPYAVEWWGNGADTLTYIPVDLRFTVLAAENQGYTTETITLTTAPDLTTLTAYDDHTFTITINVASPCLASYGLDPATNSCLPCASGYAKHTAGFEECEYVWGCSDDLSLGKFQSTNIVQMASVGFGGLIGAIALNWMWSTGASPFVEQKGVPLGLTPPLSLIAAASLIFAILVTLAAAELEGYEGRSGMAATGSKTAFITAAWLQFLGATLALKATTLPLSHACILSAWVTFAVTLSHGASDKAYVASIFVALAAAQVFLPYLSVDPRHPSAAGLRGSLTLVTMAVLTGLGLALTLFIHTPC